MVPSAPSGDSIDAAGRSPQSCPPWRAGGAAQVPAALPLRIGFSGFWDAFDPRDNWFTRLLSRRWPIVVADRPDWLIFSRIGRGRHDHLRHDCVRIFYTGENEPPDWQACDWAFTFGHLRHPRHFRLPLWGLYGDPARLVHRPDRDPRALVAAKTRFCSFVVSNPLCPVRNAFFHRLSRYRPVDSGGRLFNTLGRRVDDKMAFIAQSKFTIAFENESTPGYTTEKVMEPMLVDSIPIYWGDPLVGRDFDTRSFLSAHDSPSLEDLVERVVAVDRDPALHARLLGTPWLRGNRVPDCVAAERVLDQFGRIFTTPVEPVARRRGIVHSLGLHRAPAAVTSLRRRLRRRWLTAICPRRD
jgi:hypothetical protein